MSEPRRWSARQLVILECTEARRGTADDGREWVRYDVKAALPDGTPVRHRLSSFERLPAGKEPIEVELSPYKGDTFTVRTPKRGGGRAVQQLRDRVDRTDERLARVEERVGGHETRIGVLELADEQRTDREADPPARRAEQDGVSF